MSGLQIFVCFNILYCTAQCLSWLHKIELFHSLVNGGRQTLYMNVAFGQTDTLTLFLQMAAGSNQYVRETHKSCRPVAEDWLINSRTAFIHSSVFSCDSGKVLIACSKTFTWPYLQTNDLTSNFSKCL